MAALSSRLSLFQSLRVLSVSSRFLSGADHWNEDPIITSVGWDSFATELRSHATIEELDIGCSVRRFDRNLNYSLTNALQVNQSLKRFRLAVLGISQLQDILDMLESRSCLLEELDIKYMPREQMHVGERAEISEMFAHALQRNSSLKVLEFRHEHFWFHRAFYDLRTV
jgi:hypothetical protein